MIALRRHYAGEGNSARRTADAKKIQNSLHTSPRDLRLLTSSSTASSVFSPSSKKNKLSYEERKKIRKERDKKREPGCSNKRAISETAAQQLTTVIIRSSIYKANKEETGSIGGDDAIPRTSNNADNSFGGREGAKRSKTDWLSAVCCSHSLAAYQTTTRRHTQNPPRTLSSISHRTTPSGCCELDSHADTCALGANFVPIQFIGRVCDVAPYNTDSYAHSGQTCILIINEGLRVGDKLANSLISPNQLHFAGTTVLTSPLIATTQSPFTAMMLLFLSSKMALFCSLNCPLPLPMNLTLVHTSPSLLTQNGIHIPWACQPHTLWRR